MNASEASLLGMCYAHIAIWLAVIFGAFAARGAARKTIAKWMMCAVLPLVYIVQSLPCHAIIYAKLKSILRNRHRYETPQRHLACRPQTDLTVLDRISFLSDEEKTFAFSVLHHYEDKIWFCRKLRCLRQALDKHTFADPFDAHGLILIAFIFNAWAYFSA